MHYPSTNYFNNLWFFTDVSARSNDGNIVHVGAENMIMVHIYNISIILKISFVSICHSKQTGLAYADIIQKRIADVCDKLPP